MNDDLNKLTEKIAYQFRDIKLLELALTHRSLTAKHNERLEFLGDSLLNFIIAEALFHKFHDNNEGTLSRMRANLVNRDMLVQLASEFSLSEFVRVGPSELKSGVCRSKSIAANAVEAIIGAIYLDSDFSTCRACVLAWYGDRVYQVDLAEHLKDPKTRLQEHLQSRRLPLPKYKITSIEGRAHRQTFHVICQVEGIEKTAEGVGGSRRRAEQAAAEKFLETLAQYS